MQSTKDEEPGRLKVSGIFRDNKNNSNQIPEIRISGLWLEKAGFAYGKKIATIIDQGMLTIVFLEDE